jgi:hypothetical protein
MNNVEQVSACETEQSVALNTALQNATGEVLNERGNEVTRKIMLKVALLMWLMSVACAPGNSDQVAATPTPSSLCADVCESYYAEASPHPLSRFTGEVISAGNTLSRSFLFRDHIVGDVFVAVIGHAFNNPEDVYIIEIPSALDGNGDEIFYRSNPGDELFNAHLIPSESDDAVYLLRVNEDELPEGIIEEIPRIRVFQEDEEYVAVFDDEGNLRFLDVDAVYHDTGIAWAIDPSSCPYALSEKGSSGRPVFGVRKDQTTGELVLDGTVVGVDALGMPPGDSPSCIDADGQTVYPNHSASKEMGFYFFTWTQ